jgi:hypothetical protein
MNEVNRACGQLERLSHFAADNCPERWSRRKGATLPAFGRPLQDMLAARSSASAVLVARYSRVFFAQRSAKAWNGGNVSRDSRPSGVSRYPSDMACSTSKALRSRRAASAAPSARFHRMPLVAHAKLEDHPAGPRRSLASSAQEVQQVQQVQQDHKRATRL